MSWVILVVAGLFEAGMVLGLDSSEGFTKLRGSLVMLVCGGISFYLLSVAMQSIPAGEAYAGCTALGTSLPGLLGVLVLRGPAQLLPLTGVAGGLGRGPFV